MSSERQEYNENTPWWGEHMHRYNEACRYLKINDRILDLACGNGVGSHFLSLHSKEIIVGGDISEETINHCLENFPTSKNLVFQVIDGTEIKYENNYFDVIISFETIEHTVNYKEMLQEFYRTLKNDGMLILSTPNKQISSPDGIIRNPYHTQEFTYTELKRLLESIFLTVELYGQKYIRYNRKSIRQRIGLLFEKLLYLKGFRKIPLFIQNKVMNCVIGKNMYPDSNDYELTLNINEIINCKTFIAICKKQ